MIETVEETPIKAQGRSLIRVRTADGRGWTSLVSALDEKEILMEPYAPTAAPTTTNPVEGNLSTTDPGVSVCDPSQHPSANSSNDDSQADFSHENGGNKFCLPCSPPGQVAALVGAIIELSRIRAQRLQAQSGVTSSMAEEESGTEETAVRRVLLCGRDIVRRTTLLSAVDVSVHPHLLSVVSSPQEATIHSAWSCSAPRECYGSNLLDAFSHPLFASDCRYTRAPSTDSLYYRCDPCAFNLCIFCAGDHRVADAAAPLTAEKESLWTCDTDFEKSAASFLAEGDFGEDHTNDNDPEDISKVATTKVHVGQYRDTKKDSKTLVVYCADSASNKHGSTHMCTHPGGTIRVRLQQ